MEGRTSGELLSLPVRLHGIQVGRAVELILDVAPMRLLGFEVRCGDDIHRFLPLAAARVGAGEIRISSALTLLDELAFYRRQGAPLRDLDAGGVGPLRDVVVRPDGTIEAVIVDGGRRVLVDDTVRLERRRLPAA